MLVSELQSKSADLLAVMGSIEASLASERARNEKLNAELTFRETKVSELVSEVSKRDTIISDHKQSIQVKQDVITAQVTGAPRFLNHNHI